MKMIEAIEWRAREFAKARHDATGVLYNDLPYFEGHVLPVREVGAEFGFTSGLWGARFLTHDTIEDTDVTREELRKEFGMEVELPVWAVTGIGENRKERNADIYRKIALYGDLMGENTPAIMKAVDRLIHFRNSPDGSSHRKMYQKEFPGFRFVIRPRVPADLWDALEKAAA